MEVLTALLNSGPATLVLLAVILVVLYKTGVLDALIALLPGKDSAKDSPIVALGTKMDELVAHYNHDTTAALTTIADGMKTIAVAEDREHEANQNMRDILVDVRNSLVNIEKYGVTCRREKP